MDSSQFEIACYTSTLRTLALVPSDVLRDETRLPNNQNDPLLRVARPTWIPTNYRPGGVLIIGKNPAGGSVSHRDVPHTSDRDFSTALGNLVKQRDISAYREWRDVAQPRAMESWRIWHTSALAVIKALEPIGCDATNVSFGNLVPFRTDGNIVRRDELLRAWERDVAYVVKLLKPRLIIKMTTKFADLSGHANVQVLGFRRSNGDRGITPSGTADLAAIRKWAESQPDART